MDNTQREMITAIAAEAGLTKERTDAFLTNLEANPDLEEELLYYYDKHDFLCKTKVAGFTMVDILIYQIDHFRAFLDRDTTVTRNNPRTMALLAIETMIKLRSNPEDYIKQYSDETGTDR